MQDNTMGINGTYGFVYSGAMFGLGCGVFTVVDNKLTGEDYVGGKYTGTATEQPDGTIKLSLSFEVPPEAAQELPYWGLHFETKLPPEFGDGAPQHIRYVEWKFSPGFVTFMFKRISDDFASWATEGFRLEKGRQSPTRVRRRPIVFWPFR